MTAHVDEAPVINDLGTYSDRELVTIADKIWRRTRLDFGGGFDWPTFAGVFPHRAGVFRAIRNELRARWAAG